VTALEPNDGLFDVVPGTTSYKPQPTFVLPGEEQVGRPGEDQVGRHHRRGPGPRVTTGPQDAKAPDYWKREAEALVLILARHHGYVTSDDLHAHYPDNPSATGAAIGALFRRLSQQGRLVLDHHRPSTRPEARSRYLGVWRLP
jgi:hypothetical protein